MRAPLAFSGFASASLIVSLCAALAVGAGCSSSSGDGSTAPGGDGGTIDGSAFDDAPPASDLDVAGESENAAGHGASATSTASAKAATELFVHEDPTLDVAKTAAQNADAVAAQISASVAPCAHANVTHAPGTLGISVTFGTGCSIAGVSYSGTVAASVAKAAGGLTVAFTFTSLDVAGTTINGTASETTADATTFSSTIDLTVDTTHVTYKGSLALDADGKGVTLTGTGTFQKGNAPSTSYSATAVHHGFGACYADAGSISYGTSTTGKSGKSYKITETISFSSTTPSTGQASAMIGTTAATVTLAPYGSCPHA